MKNYEVLKRVIEKAIKNGWNPDREDFHVIDKIEVRVNNVWICDTDMGTSGHYVFEQIIYRIDFAKCLWGNKPLPYRQYQYHLQKMVLYKNPIEYIKKFI